MYYPSLNKLQKTFIKVVNMSRFAIVGKSILLSKRCTHLKTYEVDPELGGGKLSLPAFPGWGIEHQERKKNEKLPGTQITHTRSGRLSLAPIDINTLRKGCVAIFQR